MPKLRRPNFDKFLRAFFLLQLGRLEPYFSAHTKVRNNVENDFFKHCILGKFLENVGLGIQLIRVHGSEVHDVSNI